MITVASISTDLQDDNDAEAEAEAETLVGEYVIR